MAKKGGESKLVLDQVLSQVEKLQALATQLKNEHNIDLKQLLDQPKEAVPLCIFGQSPLSSLEVIVKYLKENRGKSYHEIASKLNRDDRTVWVTYSKAQAKYRKKLVESPSLAIPLSLFASREKSVLETVVCYLKDKHNLSFHKIAEQLGKHYQTIYTVYRRGSAR